MTNTVVKRSRNGQGFFPYFIKTKGQLIRLKINASNYLYNSIYKQPFGRGFTETELDLELCRSLNKNNTLTTSVEKLKMG